MDEISSQGAMEFAKITTSIEVNDENIKMIPQRVVNLSTTLEHNLLNGCIPIVL